MSDTSKTLRLTRDSVAMGDDMDAPHAAMIAVAPDADAAAIAQAILAANYLAWVGSTATWSIMVGPDLVVFGYRDGGTPFVMPGDGPLASGADQIDALHVTYLRQSDPRQVLAEARDRDTAS